MAQIHEETLTIKFSKLMRAGDKIRPIINPDIISTLEAAAQELAGNQVIVELINNPEA